MERGERGVERREMGGREERERREMGERGERWGVRERGGM